MTIDNAYIELAHRLAEKSGAILRGSFRTPVKSHHKADQSPVTEADIAVEKALRELITASFPEHGIYGEEQGVHKADADYVWVIDPIDGTKAFMAGIPTFTTLIALVHRGEPLMGIINQPISHETWLGVRGKPTTLNGKEIRSSDCQHLAEAMLSTTSPYLFASDEKAAFESLRNATARQVYGGDAYGYAMLASGGVDVVLEAGLKPYDICALIPVIEGAGGIITDWDGKKLACFSPQHHVLAAATPQLHAQALKALS